MSTLVARTRTDYKKSALKKLRNEGHIPAVVYGSNIDTVNVAVNESDLAKIIRKEGRNGVFSLQLEEKSKNVLLRDYQRDPISQKILHVDFLQVNKDTEIDAKVTVVLKGQSEGEKAGGITKQFIHELDVTATAANLPDNIVIDVTDFEIGRSVQVGDIKKQYSNCTFKHEDDETIVLIDYVKAKSEEDDNVEEEVPSTV